MNHVIYIDKKNKKLCRSILTAIISKIKKIEIVAVIILSNRKATAIIKLKKPVKKKLHYT